VNSRLLKIGATHIKVEAARQDAACGTIAL
jgi:hypothetical protein